MPGIKGGVLAPTCNSYDGREGEQPIRCLDEKCHRGVSRSWSRASIEHDSRISLMLRIFPLEVDGCSAQVLFVVRQ